MNYLPSRAALSLAIGQHAALIASVLALVVITAAPVHAAPPSPGPGGAGRYLTGRLLIHEPRSRGVDVRHMALNVRIMPKRHQATGVVTYTGVARSMAPTLVLHAVDLDISKVSLRVGGATVSAPQHATNQTLRLHLKGAQIGTKFSVELTWQVTRPAMGLYFRGPDADEPDRPVHIWTQGETHGLRHWLPSPDDPDERLTWKINVEAPKGLTILSNGKPGTTTKRGQLQTATYTLDTPYPLYLFTLAIGPFVAQRHPHKRVRIESWAFAKHAKRAAKIGRKTGGMLDFFEQVTGTPYAHDRYGHVYVDEFIAGGMENITLTTLTSNAIGTARTDLDRRIDGLLAHELAHQWFGDLVTCRTWADLWLNEGFATFYQKLWTLHDLGLQRFAEEMASARRGALGADHATQRPVVTDRYRHPSELFDGHAYPKGAWVLHMLRERLGHRIFDAGIALYLRTHRHHSVETADLRRAMEQVSGRSLRGFFKRWLRQPGAPKIKARIRWDSRRKTLRVNLSQIQKIDGQRPGFILPVEIAYAVGGTIKRDVIRLDGKRASWSTHLSSPPDWVMVDPRMRLFTAWKLQADADLMRGTAKLAPHPDARLRAIGALKGVMNRRPVVRTLLTILRADKARHVRRAAARVLGSAPRRAVRAGLQTALRRDPEAQVRSAAAAALGELRDRASLPLLRRAAASDRSIAVRSASLRAVFIIDRRRSRPLLLQATAWRSWRDRLAGVAMMLLGRLADPRDLDRLWAASKVGQRKTLRASAVLALAAFAVRVKAAREPVREHVEAMLQEESARLRSRAVAALKTLSLPASRRPLLAAADREASFRMALRMRKVAKKLGQKLTVEERIRSLEKSLAQLEERAREGKMRRAKTDKKHRRGVKANSSAGQSEKSPARSKSKSDRRRAP